MSCELVTIFRYLNGYLNFAIVSFHRLFLKKWAILGLFLLYRHSFQVIFTQLKLQASGEYNLILS